jgi:cbb3-type cytochrome oxidase maturation protein
MDSLIYLIAAAMLLGLVALGGFMWALKSGQFEDLEGAANRILFDDDDMSPEPEKPSEEKSKKE